MNHSKTWKKFFSKALFLSLSVFFAACMQRESPEETDQTQADISNPYSDVRWDTFSEYKAALHVHTLQSDGYHMVDEVVQAYRNTGFSILAITDHDKMEPNAQFERGRIDWADYDEIATPFPEDPKPENYPQNTTWPWTDFHGPDPGETGMLAIEGAEISYLHHMNSFFSGYGDGYTASHEDEQLDEMMSMGGLAFFNHPSNAAPYWGGERRPLEWYVGRFKKYPAEFLIGMDIPGVANMYNRNLWDQLLSYFMPDRPIWGFSTDDMHRLDNTRQSHTVFILDKLNETSVREAMTKGQFYFRQSSKRVDLLTGNDGSDEFPKIEAIDVDSDAGTITIHADNYDNISWITSPGSAEELQDSSTGEQPWPAGRVVHDGAILHYRDIPGIEKYVRAEIQRIDGDDIYLVFTNPFGIRDSQDTGIDPHD